MEHSTHMRLAALLGVLSVSLIIISLAPGRYPLHGSSEGIDMPMPSGEYSSPMNFYYQYMMEVESADVPVSPSVPMPVTAPTLMQAAPVQSVGASTAGSAGCTDVCNLACPVYNQMACAAQKPASPVPPPIPVPPVVPSVCANPCDSACPTYDPMNCGGGSTASLPTLPSAPACPDVCNPACPDFNVMLCTGPVVVPPMPPAACDNPCSNAICPGYDPMDCVPGKAVAPASPQDQNGFINPYLLPAADDAVEFTADTTEKPLSQDDSIPPDPTPLITLAESVINMLKQLVMQLYGR